MAVGRDDRDTFPAVSNEPPPPVRRRPLVAIPGWLLFVCLFLPTLKVCSAPEAPITFPPAYAVYLGAIAIAVGAMSGSLRIRRRAHAILLGLWFATGAGIAAAMIGSIVTPVLGWLIAAAGLALSIVLIVRLARVPWSVRGVIGGWIAHAVIASAWNMVLAGTGDAVWGAYVALGASGALLVASAVALSSENARRKDGGGEDGGIEHVPELPRAHARSRDL
jgi:hypothetical protein